MGQSKSQNEKLTKSLQPIMRLEIIDAGMLEQNPPIYRFKADE
jgi:hypothetical protein